MSSDAKLNLKEKDERKTLEEQLHIIISKMHVQIDLEKHRSRNA
jgi:hypothetical protein